MVESNLARKWAADRRERSVKVPVSVRLRPETDCRIQELQERFPHLTASQIINDLLAESLDRVWRMGLE